MIDVYGGPLAETAQGLPRTFWPGGALLALIYISLTKRLLERRTPPPFSPLGGNIMIVKYNANGTPVGSTKWGKAQRSEAEIPVVCQDYGRTVCKAKTG